MSRPWRGVVVCVAMLSGCTSRGPTSPSVQTFERTPTPIADIPQVGPPASLVVSTHATGSDFDRLPIPMIPEVNAAGTLVGMAAIAVRVMDVHGYGLQGTPMTWSAPRGYFRRVDDVAGQGGRAYAEFILDGGTVVMTISAGSLSRSLLFHAP